MGRSVQAEQGHYGCLDVLSSCFKKSSKLPHQPPRPDTPNARPACAKRYETESGQSYFPLPHSNISNGASSVVLNFPDSQVPSKGDEISVQPPDRLTHEVQQHEVLDLWKEAFEEIDQDYKKSISANLPSVGEDPVEQLIKLVQDKEERFKDRSGKITVGDREILWRDCATRVISLLSAAVDVGIHFAPTPGPAVWSALKVLLKAHVSGCESVAAMFGCADRVLRLINRGAIYEQVFLRSRPVDLDACEKDLRNALVNAYRSALELLDYARTKLEDGVAVRQFFEALWNPHETQDKLNELQEAEKILQEIVLACDIKTKHLRDENSLRLLDQLNEPLRYIDRKVDRILTEMEDEKLLKTLNFICKINVGDQHNSMKSKRTQRTGEWLSKQKEFHDWENSSSSNILWLSGKVGAGKSVLTSNIIDRYLVNEHSQDEFGSNFDEGFAFFYYSKNNKDVTNDPVNNVLRSFLRQLARVPHYANRISSDLASLCQNMEKAQRVFTPELCRDKIPVLINTLPRTTLVLDSLDELEPQHMQEIVSFFVKLVDTSERPVKIFISSRFTTDIYNEIKKANKKTIRMDIAEQNQGDIESFIQARTKRIDCRWRDEEVREEVVAKISKDAKGMFRWAFLQIDQLIQFDSPDDVRRCLGKLPDGLTAAYDELYAKSGSHDQVYLRRAVKWVTHAHRPLSTSQLLSAVQLRLADEQNNEQDDLVLVIRDRRLSEQALESICRYLIVKDGQGEWVFPHASVQEYFVEEHSALTNNVARIEVAKLSMLVLMETYRSSPVTGSLKSGQAGHETEGDDDNFTDWRYRPESRNSLEHYVSGRWGSHIREIQGVPNGSKQISELLKRFLISPDSPYESTPEYRRWWSYAGEQGFQRDFGMWRIRFFEHDLKPIRNPAFGIARLGINLDENEWAKDCMGFRLRELSAGGLDALSLAAKYGHAGLCVSLIAMGSDPNKILMDKTSALDQAIMSDEMVAVKTLLEHGADPNINTYKRPLCQATSQGRREMVELLIGYGAHPDRICRRCKFGSALAAAAYANNRDITEMSIAAGADVNLRLNGEYGTPLMAAAYGGSLDVWKLLVQNGADVNIKSERSMLGGVLGAALCGLEAMIMVPYLIEEAGIAPKRIIEDHRGTRIYSEDVLSAWDICDWLLSKKHLSPEEVEGGLKCRLRARIHWGDISDELELDSGLELERS